MDREGRGYNPEPPKHERFQKGHALRQLGGYVFYYAVNHAIIDLKDVSKPGTESVFIVWDIGNEIQRGANMRDFYDVVDARRTVRDFENEAIDDKVIERVISAGMKAPTNDHMRDWHFIVIKDKKTVVKLVSKIPKKLSDAEINAILRDWNLNDTCQQNAYKDAIPKQYRMLTEAACVIVPLFKQKTDIFHPENLSHLNGYASIWCCLENMFLAITAEGYASALRIPLGDEEDWARKVLNFPEDYFMPCFITVGKASANASYVEQKEYSLPERIHKNLW